MNRYIPVGFICSLLLFFMIGVCIADETPVYLGYVQGGKSTITDGENGTSVITVNDVIPYFIMAAGNRGYLIPARLLTNKTYPLNAAVVFSGDETEATFMVNIYNMSLSAGNKSLTLRVKPLTFYDGQEFKYFPGEGNETKWKKEIQSTRVWSTFGTPGDIGSAMVPDQLVNNTDRDVAWDSSESILQDVPGYSA